MPPQDEVRSQRNGRFILVFRYLLLAVYFFYAVNKTSLPYSALGIYLRRAIPLVIVGIAAGVLFLGVRNLAASLWPGLGWNNPKHPMLKGPVEMWVAIVCVGGFSEELWRAFCLVKLQSDGLQAGAAILATATVFAMSQLGGKPSLISARPVELFSAVVLGVGIAILFLRFNSLLLVGATNITYYLGALYLFRNRTSQPAGTN